MFVTSILEIILVLEMMADEILNLTTHTHSHLFHVLFP